MLNQNLASFAQVAMPPQGPPAMQGHAPPQQGKFTPAELAALGRFGDSIVAHLTPGEIAVPPEVQSPKVLATLKTAFKKEGAPLENFVAGSPQSSINPQTGMPEYNFLASILPMALGLAGSAVFPAMAPAMAAASPMAASALGGGIGTALGGLASGQKPLQAGLAGLGSGLGGYMLGNAFGPTTPDISKMAAANPAAGTPGIVSQTPFGPPMPPMSIMDRLKDSVMNPNIPMMAGSALGGMVGSAIGEPQRPGKPPKPSGFDSSMPHVSQLTPWNEALGQTTYRGPLPSFNGFDPFATNAMGYSFFPARMQ